MKKTRKSLWRLLFKFHRYTGLGMALIIVMLAVTGIILNHTDDLKLDSHYVKSKAILDWYGIASSKPKIAFASRTHWVIQSGEQIYLGSQPIIKKPEPLVGLVSSDTFLLLGFTTGLILLSNEGEIIERIEKPISRIAIDSLDTVIIESKDRVLSSDDALLSWLETEKIPEWSIPSNPPATLLERINKLSRNNILPYERVLLDIHSGRFFGPYGVLMVDIAGILFILLAVSGCWIWLRHRLRHRRKPK
jgi:hypothetical protein